MTRPARSRKQVAALVSVASNATLIGLKIAAGLITGSVAILSDAVQSTADLLASLIAFFSIRKAEQPADESHPYGHARLEDFSAAIEALLILLGAAIILFQGVRRLIHPAALDSVGVGIAVIALAGLANLLVSTYLGRTARATESPALAGDAAHLRTDAVVSAGVLVGLVLGQLTGAHWIDPVVALVVGAAIARTGLALMIRSSRVLVDEAPPEEDLDAIKDAVRSFADQGVVGFHELRARHAGGRHLVDLHVQFADDSRLKDAHATAHDLQAAIQRRLPHTDVLIHLEPESKMRPGGEVYK